MMNARGLVVLTFLLLLTLPCHTVRAADAGPRPGLKSLGADGSLRVSPQDRCPVCAMQVSQHARFASAIELTDGRTYYFCGTGCMIRSWMHPEDFMGAGPGQLKRPVVRDYFSGRFVDGRRVTWVAGSDIVGPMGPALVPIANRDELETFKRRHGGKSTFRLEEMTDEKWKALTGKNARR